MSLSNLNKIDKDIGAVFKSHITAINRRLVKTEGILIFYYTMISIYTMVSVRCRGHRVLIGHSAIGFLGTPVS